MKTRLRWLLFSLAVVIIIFLWQTPDWAGWLLVYAGIVVMFTDPRLRSDHRSQAAMLFVLMAHHAAALINLYWWTLPGADYDALTFHLYAVEHIYESQELNILVGSQFYENVLAAAYLLGGDSLFFGQELSVFVFTLSCLLFVRFLDLLGVERHRPWLLLLFGALPSAVVYGSLTLREAYELFFFMLGVYSGMRVFVAPRWWMLPVCIASFLGMGMFHQVLMVYALFATALLLIVPLFGSHVPYRGTIATGGVAIVFVLGVLLLSGVATMPGDDYIGMSRADPVKALVKYRQVIELSNPRTAFGVELDNTSAPRLAGTAALVYLHYLAAPFPWNVESVMDAYAFAEAVLRLLLIVTAIFVLCRVAPSYRRILVTMVLLYVSMTALWAVGTTNYGQAIRHHVLSNWILILVSGPALIEGLLTRVQGGRGWLRRRFGSAD